MFDAVAEGRPTLVLPDLIVAETAYVLGSARVEPSEAAGHLLGVLERPGVEVMDRASSATLSSCGAKGGSTSPSRTSPRPHAGCAAWASCPSIVTSIVSRG